ncbi:glycoside hydrolase family 127 protein [Neolewinella lacunae]|uniref:Glycoside hydrolase family 127 protein n=1 Tax=Neolewinella lacunae TaxID=1517758 RepID=A0A923PHI9_9BACT|nr:beta-L-arabinofuranosidase domain-containing protein [Neolewinella lacunae]MBC6994238.1 glycoside hydrolase family 127 protein [Neolewinella lacunae]MDN3637144.1 glycoside hydrolase family 127 protein [Neolewinella lacunae]
MTTFIHFALTARGCCAVVCFSCCLWLAACQPTAPAAAPENVAPAYALAPVDIQNVKMEDNFWLPIIRRVQEKTIAYALQKCEEEGRMDNFLIAGGQLPGTVKGAMPFDDTDLYKIIEGASNSLISSPNDELSHLLDTLIAIIAVGQEEDGYLTTWRTINPAAPPAKWVAVDQGVRWESLGASHELYNAGHLYEAAVVHHLATNKRNFLDIALKNADLMVATFGEGAGKIQDVPGHQIIETGLIKLYQLTGKQAYLELARYFLDNRGNADNHKLYGPYSQDHLPVTQQTEVVGHAVRAVYMYAAMTDVAVLMNDEAYASAVDRLWENMVGKKTYLTGGIGARHEGESFGENYELPNLTAYAETCAAIGSVYWAQRLHRKTGKVEYLDVMERTLYNGLIAGLSLDGTKFFYPNALASDGVYLSNFGSCTRQNWFDCSCCPTNLIRFLPAVPGLLYATGEQSIFTNLYAASTAEIALGNTMFSLRQRTDYPWDGQVSIEVNPAAPSSATLKFRVPSWARNVPMPGELYAYLGQAEQSPTISLNGEVLDLRVENGYFTVTRNWQAGDRVELSFPMPVRKVVAAEQVEENREHLALERGPLVYAVESIDNPSSFENIEVSVDDAFAVEAQDILGGIQVVRNAQLTAVPYYAWSNRGVGKMKVWLKRATP